MVKDPVCGMEIEPTQAAAVHEHRGRSYFFCSADCEAKFLQDPDRYAGASEPLVGSLTTGYNPDLTGAVHVELPVAGLRRGRNARAVETSLREAPGVEQAHVNATLGVAHVVFDPARTDLGSLAAVVQKA